jgi:tRNA A-37 threonylcarbamoyl transferase component Bud32
MESHIFIYHKENLVLFTHNYNNNHKHQQNLLIKSPYLVPGILKSKRIYDEKYNLSNFIPIYENGEPKLIGNGSYGQVYLALNKRNKKLYAIKHMQKKILLQKLNNSLESIYKEINFQSIIEHPNIVQILYANETSEDFNIVLEYSSKGNLFYFIRNNKYLEEDMAFLFFIQMVNTIYFLHKNNLIHRDIKPENILLFDNNVVKLERQNICHLN